jgi:hypothetical protein
LFERFLVNLAVNQFSGCVNGRKMRGLIFERFVLRILFCE